MNWFLLRIRECYIHIWIQYISSNFHRNILETLTHLIQEYHLILYIHKKIMMKSNCENLWADNSGIDLGRHTTVDYGSADYDATKTSQMDQHSLMSKMLSLRIKNSLNTDGKIKLRVYNTSYVYNGQDHWVKIFFVVCSDIKAKIETWIYLSSRNIYLCQTHRYNNLLMIYPLKGKPTQKIWSKNSTSTPHHHAQSSRNTRISAGKSGAAYQIRSMDLNKIQKLLTSGRCYTNNPKDSEILALVGASQRLMD